MLRRLQNNNKIHQFMLKLVNLKNLLHNIQSVRHLLLKHRDKNMNLQHCNLWIVGIRRSENVKYCILTVISVVGEFNSLIKNLFNYKK